MARSGTRHISYLFQELFKFIGDNDGISTHQKGFIADQSRNTLDAFWEYSLKLTQIAQKNPNIRFIILHRNIEDCCNSLKNFYTHRRHPDADKDIDWFAVHYWFRIYKHILEHIKTLDPKPILIDYDRYVAGEYDGLLLDIFNIEKSGKNLAYVRQLFDKRVNSYGDYENTKLSPKFYKQAEQVYARLEEACAKSWIDEPFPDSPVNRNYPDMCDMYKQRLFGAVMGQSFPALFVFEWLLNLYPFDYIIEVGTGCGGLSMYLAYQAKIRGLGYSTYDAMDRTNDKKNFMTHNPPKDVGKYLNKNKKNVFDQKTIDEISTIMKDNRILFYTDNGAKPKEVATYSAFLKKGDVMGTHDWCPVQFKSVNISQIEKDRNMVVIFEEFCEQYKTRMRWWYKAK